MMEKRPVGRPKNSKKRMYQYLEDYGYCMKRLECGESLRSVSRTTHISPTTLIKVKRMVGL